MTANQAAAAARRAVYDHIKALEDPGYFAARLEALKASGAVPEDATSLDLTLQAYMAFVDFLNNLECPEGGWSKEDFQKILKAGTEAVEFIGTQQGDSTTGHRAPSVDFPLDKVNGTIWKITKEGNQSNRKIAAEAQGEKKRVNIIYSINFDGIESAVPVLKRLTNFDKQVYVVAASLWKAGNDTLTIGQIYHELGRDGTPGKGEREKIDNAMTKFHAVIKLSNAEEIAAGYKYPRYTYDGPLLPFYRRSTLDRKNGQLVEAQYYISLDRNKISDFPLIDFARGRKQIATIPQKMLQTPISKTESNIALEDYLTTRIERARAGKMPEKILLTTLYEKTGITTKMQRQRAPEKIKLLMDHYQDCGAFTSYKMDKTSIVINFEEKKAPKKKGKSS